MTTYISPAGLHPCYLDSRTATGLIQCDPGTEDAALFWVLEERERRFAIRLSDEPGRPQARWMTFLMDEDGDRLGLHLGEVDVEIDFDTVVLNQSQRGEVGQVYIRDGKILLAARGRQYSERTNFQIGEAPAGSDAAACACFPRWRLVQRRGDKDPLVLFESQPAA